MPYADPAKNVEANRRWRLAHPGYSRGKRAEEPPLSRYQVLDEDLVQQAELYRLSRRRDEHPMTYRTRERQWISATYSGEPREWTEAD